MAYFNKALILEKTKREKEAIETYKNFLSNATPEDLQQIKYT
jgi:hypothetical protein